MELFELRQIIAREGIKEGNLVEITAQRKGENSKMRKEIEHLYFGAIEDIVVILYRKQDESGKIIKDYDAHKRDDYFCHYFIAEIEGLRRINFNSSPAS